MKLSVKLIDIDSRNGHLHSNSQIRVFDNVDVASNNIATLIIFVWDISIVAFRMFLPQVLNIENLQDICANDNLGIGLVTDLIKLESIFE